MLAAEVGADVPFFLAPGPKLAEGAGERTACRSTYRRTSGCSSRFQGAARRSRQRRSTAASTSSAGAAGFDERRVALLDALASVRRPRDFASFPAQRPRRGRGQRRRLIDELRRPGRVPGRRERRRPGCLRPLPPSGRCGARPRVGCGRARGSGCSRPSGSVAGRWQSSPSSSIARAAARIGCASGRLRIALLIAFVESLLVSPAMHRLVLGRRRCHRRRRPLLSSARRTSSRSAHEITWIAAASQLISVFVPVLWVVVKVLAILALVLIASLPARDPAPRSSAQVRLRCVRWLDDGGA